MSQQQQRRRQQQMFTGFLSSFKFGPIFKVSVKKIFCSFDHGFVEGLTNNLVKRINGKAVEKK